MRRPRLLHKPPHISSKSLQDKRHYCQEASSPKFLPTQNQHWLISHKAKDVAILGTISSITNQKIPVSHPGIKLLKMSLDNDINIKKRKLQDDEKPRKKQKKHNRPTRDDDADLDVEAGLNRAFARMDGQLLADHLAQKTRRFGTELSPVELNDLYISGEYTISESQSPYDSFIEAKKEPWLTTRLRDPPLPRRRRPEWGLHLNSGVDQGQLII